MSKKKNTNTEEKKTSPDASLPEDKPDSVNMSPAVEDTKADAGVLKRGVAMEKVDSPRFGVPGQATATRAAAGGGAYNPSGQVGRTPTNPEVRGAGSDPLNKMDIRDELAWNDIGAAQFRTLIEGSAAGFAPDAILGNFTFEDNLVFQFDNAGRMPGVKNLPYRRRVTSISKDQCVFVTGQHDNASKVAMQFYPTVTYSRTGARQTRVLDGSTAALTPVTRSNYLMRGMFVSVGYSNGAFAITGIDFDTEELPCQSTPEDLDVRYDNARVIWDLADRDITEKYFGLVNEGANLQANKYSPLPDGQPQAIQHLILSRDVAVTDGTIAFLAARSAMETYAYHRSMRSTYGAGEGARAQARCMLAERVLQNEALDTGLWADNTNMTGVVAGMGTADTVGAHDTAHVKLSMPEYIQTCLDSPTKYNAAFGVWLTQPRGLRLLFEELQKSFDDGKFIIDKDTFHLLNKVVGWHDLDGRLAGVARVGIITPVDYADLYECNSDGDIVPDESGVFHSKYTYCDYVLNGSMYNNMEIRSPLVDAILQVFRYRVLPKLRNHDHEYEFYVPFDFACDHYSFGHAVLMEAMAYIHQFMHSARAIFDRFNEQYGVDPLMSDLNQSLTLADVMSGSGYKGIGADPVFPQADEGLRLLMYLPEVYQMGVRTWDGGLEFPDCMVAIKFTDLAPISDSIDEPQRLLFPMLYKTEVMGQWRRIKDMGPEKLLCSRDWPIHRYELDMAGYERHDEYAAAAEDTSQTPFFGRQMPQVYHCERTNDSALVLSIEDILCAPRYSGRIAPAPMGMLNFVRVAGGDPDCGVFYDLMLSQSGDGDLTYGWAADMHDHVIEVVEESNNIRVEERDIDNYNVSFVYMPRYEMNQLGMLLHRYQVHFGSGAMSQATLNTVQRTYGIWVSPEQQSVNIDDVVATVPGATKDLSIAAGSNATLSQTFNTVVYNNTEYDLDPTSDNYIGDTVATIAVEEVSYLLIKRWKITNSGDATFEAVAHGKSHGVSLKYENDAMKMWTSDNITEFVFSPFTGNVSVVLDNNGGVSETIDHDITLPLMFGFAGYQELWYDRLNNANYATKQAVGGRIYDDAMLKKSNVLFE